MRPGPRRPVLLEPELDDFSDEPESVLDEAPDAGGVADLSHESSL